MRITLGEIKKHNPPPPTPTPTFFYYRKNPSISRTLAGIKIVDNSDVVGASPVGAAPTTSSFLT